VRCLAEGGAGICWAAQAANALSSRVVPYAAFHWANRASALARWAATCFPIVAISGVGEEPLSAGGVQLEASGRT
jgi:hypothetical protein